MPIPNTPENPFRIAAAAIASAEEVGVTRTEQGFMKVDGQERHVTTTATSIEEIDGIGPLSLRHIVGTGEFEPNTLTPEQIEVYGGRFTKLGKIATIFPGGEIAAAEDAADFLSGVDGDSFEGKIAGALGELEAYYDILRRTFERQDAQTIEAKRGEHS